MKLEIKTLLQLKTCYDRTKYNEKWVSVESLLMFIEMYDYYDYLVEALKEELEEKQ